MQTPYYLLEKKILKRSHYIGVKGGMFRWIEDKDKALHLARREDADRLAEVIDDCEAIVGYP